MPCQFSGEGRKRQLSEEEGKEFDENLEEDDATMSEDDDGSQDGGKDDYNFYDDPLISSDSDVEPEVWEKYFKESESFDLSFYPGPSFNHSVVPYKRYLRKRMRKRSTVACAELHFKNSILRTRKTMCWMMLWTLIFLLLLGYSYYFTFEATDPDEANAPKTFQAQVWCPISKAIRIDFCRFRKYSQNQGDDGSPQFNADDGSISQSNMFIAIMKNLYLCSTLSCARIEKRILWCLLT